MLSIVLLTLHLKTRIILLSHLLFNLVFAFLKSRVDWSRVCQDLQESRWGNVYNRPDSVHAFNELFISIISRRVPTSIIRRRLTENACFNDNCINAFNNKNNDYPLWKCNRTQLLWDEYVRCVMPRLFIALHAVTVFVNLLTQPHTHINGNLH